MDFTFGKRYLVILILVYLLSTFLSLNFPQFLPQGSIIFYVYSVLFIMLLFVSLCVFCIVAKQKDIKNMGIFSFFMVVVFIIGVIRFSVFSNSVATKEVLLGDNPTVCGVVKSTPALSSTQKSYAVNFDIYNVNDNSVKNIPIKLYIPSDLAVPQIGDIITCKLTLNLENPPAFKEGFDYKEYLRQNGFVSAYYAGKAEFLGTKALNPLISLGLKIRNAITDSVDSCPYTPDNAELLKGILIGDISGFSDELYNNYTDSGFIHIASVSGMHTSYILMFLAGVLFLIRFPGRFKALIAIPVLIIFASVSLFTASVLRAVIMASILLIAPIFKRRNDSITALFISAFILVFHNPYTLTSTSFLLSYGATLGILVYFTSIRDCISTVISSKNSITKYFVKSVSLSVSATIGISYFTAKFFGKLQLGGIIGNLLIGFLVAIVFFCGYANCILLSINEGLAQTLAYVIINPCLSAINNIAAFFSKEIFHFNILSPPDSFFVIYLIICGAMYMLLNDDLI